LGPEPVFSDADRIRLGLERELDFHVVRVRAKDDGDRGRVIRGAFVLVEEIQIEVHPSSVLGLEWTDLDFEGDQALQKAVTGV
jgi:hypothetical protein